MMGAELEPISESALQFFGKMTASISHEINNVLAIINENAGLLTDFVLMADKGRPIDPERLKTLAEKIGAQIRRADNIVRNMNKFAHSVDESIKRIDLSDLLELMVTLLDRTASMQGVALELIKQENPVFIKTNVFLLENLLWLCLNFVMDAPGHDEIVTLNAENGEKCVVVCFSRSRGFESEIGTMSPLLTRQDGLLEALKGKLTTDKEAGEVVLTLPLDIEP